MYCLYFSFIDMLNYVTANFGYFMSIFALGLKLHRPWGEVGGLFDTNLYIHISFSLFKWRLNSKISFLGCLEEPSKF